MTIFEEEEDYYPTAYLQDMQVYNHTLDQEAIEEELRDRDSKGESQ